MLLQGLRIIVLISVPLSDHKISTRSFYCPTIMPIVGVKIDISVGLRKFSKSARVSRRGMRAVTVCNFTDSFYSLPAEGR